MYIYISCDERGRERYNKSYQVRYRPTRVCRFRCCCPNGPRAKGTLVVAGGSGVLPSGFREHRGRLLNTRDNVLPIDQHRDNYISNLRSPLKQRGFANALQSCLLHLHLLLFFVSLLAFCAVVNLPRLEPARSSRSRLSAAARLSTYCAAN